MAVRRSRRGIMGGGGSEQESVIRGQGSGVGREL
jgi:hypothetical protein